jgi:hypothetical protein
MGDADPTRAFRIDAAVLAVAFAAALRSVGITGGPERAVWLVRSLQLMPPHRRSDLYWACRVVFLDSVQQVPRFDAVFDAVFGGALDLADTRGATDLHDATTTPRRAQHDRLPAPIRGGSSDDTLPAAAGDDKEHDDDSPETDAFLLAASREERLHSIAFDRLQPDELARIRTLITALALRTPLRAGRRYRRSPRSRDRLDMRRTVRAAIRTGGDPVHLQHARPRPRPRQLVLLCDVSASMEPYSRAFLSFMQAAVAGRHAEAFTFATRLTRLTRQLRLHDPDEALQRATSTTRDWSGGTRLADGLRSFIDAFGRRGLARGAVVVVFSDGWAQEDPADVGLQMARLQRLAFRIVWVNPRKAAQGYQPLAGGMAAALPYCDAFVSGHSYSALQELVHAIGADVADASAGPRLAESSIR